MKNLALTALGALMLFIGSVYAAKNYLRPVEFMSLKKVCRLWGERPFNEAKFKAAGEDKNIRAKMTCSLLKNNVCGKLAAKLAAYLRDESL